MTKKKLNKFEPLFKVIDFIFNSWILVLMFLSVPALLWLERRIK